jgi:putative peptide zinc metalloprotease protein
VIAELNSPQLDLTIAAAAAAREQAIARERQALSQMPAGIEPMRRRREALDLQLEELKRDREALRLRAPVTGQWVSPRSDELTDMWLQRGTALGDIIGQGDEWEFFAVVPQDYAGDLFGNRLKGAEIRFFGSAGDQLPVEGWHVVPGRQDILPSPALGWPAGGSVRVRLDDPRGQQTAEPFFLVVAKVKRHGNADTEAQLLWQNRTGVIRFDLPWSPLLVQWARQFRQLLQERYQI